MVTPDWLWSPWHESSLMFGDSQASVVQLGVKNWNGAAGVERERRQQLLTLVRGGRSVMI